MIKKAVNNHFGDKGVTNDQDQGRVDITLALLDNKKDFFSNMRTNFQASLLFVIINFITVSSCNLAKKDLSTADGIIQECIRAHGGKSYDKMDISYDFRQFRIRLKQDHGQYHFERAYKDSLGNNWVEMLTNENFVIKKNDRIYIPADSARQQKQEGLNAVTYFALLPYKLADPAVVATHAGSIDIEGKSYEKILVSFREEKGGKDHHDQFCFWIDRETHQLKYLAYSNGGPRFRKAINSNQCGGIIIQDYENYSMTDTSIATENFDTAFIQGKFKLLSLIEQSNFNHNLAEE